MVVAGAPAHSAVNAIVQGLQPSLTGATLLIIANITFGRWFGPAGLIWGYVVTGACVMVPFGLYLLHRKRRACGYPPFKVERNWAKLASGAR